MIPNKRWKLSLVFLLCTSLGAQNHTSVKPLPCYVADGDRENLAASITFATATNIVAFRTIPPLLTLFKFLIKPTGGHKINNRFLQGVYTGLDRATEAPVGLITAVHALAVISFLVPPYYIRQSFHSRAQCDHSLAIQNAPNTTQPESCYLADSNDRIFNINLGYALGMYLGVYLFLPVLASSIRGWLRGVPAATTEIDHTPNAVVSIVSDSESTTGGCCNRIKAAFASALETAMIPSNAYALVDAEQWTAILTYLYPLLGWFEKFKSHAECEHDKAAQTVDKST